MIAQIVSMASGQIVQNMIKINETFQINIKLFQTFLNYF